VAYTTAAAIQAEFKSLTFSGTTAVTSDDVTEFIAQEEAALDGRLAKKYVVPITGTEALKVAKMLSTLYVKARIMDILAVKTGDPKADQGSTGSSLRKRADEMVKQIVDGSFKLTDATSAESTDGVADYVSGNLDEGDCEPPSIARTFRRDFTQW
jgi:hypothetical protein